MGYLISEIILFLILALILGFLIGWLARVWPFWKRFSEYEESFKLNQIKNDRAINQTRIDFENKLKEFQINYEERMHKFKSEYEEGINNYQNDYAEGFSSFVKEYKIFEKEMLALKNNLEHKMTEYSSKYYYLENKFKNDLTNKDYEDSIAALKEKIVSLEKRLATQKQSGKTAVKAKAVSKKKSAKTVKGSEKDNLQLINGIGKVLEGMLNKQKVYTFKQIADMSKEDLEKISKKVIGFSDKVKKYKWINQAKSLYKKSIKK